MVDFDVFPKQGDALNKSVLVYFRYDGAQSWRGTVIRNDIEGQNPLTIIKLKDGRVLMGHECQWEIDPAMTLQQAA